MKSVGDTNTFDLVATKDAFTLGVKCVDELPEPGTVPNGTLVQLLQATPGLIKNHVYQINDNGIVDLTRSTEVVPTGSGNLNMYRDGDNLNATVFAWNTVGDLGNDKWLYDELVMSRSDNWPTRACDGTSVVRRSVKDGGGASFFSYISGLTWGQVKDRKFRLFHHYASGKQTYDDYQKADSGGREFIIYADPISVGTIAPLYTYRKAGVSIDTASSKLLNLVIQYEFNVNLPDEFEWKSDTITTANGVQLMTFSTPTYETLVYDDSDTTADNSTMGVYRTGERGKMWVRLYNYGSKFSQIVSITTDVNMQIRGTAQPVQVNSVYQNSAGDTVTLIGHLTPGYGWDWVSDALKAGLGSKQIVGVPGALPSNSESGWPRSQARGSYEEPQIAPAYWPHQIWITQIDDKGALYEAVLSSVNPLSLGYVTTQVIATSSPAEKKALAETMWEYMCPGSGLHGVAEPTEAYYTTVGPGIACTLLKFKVPKST